MKTIHLSPEEIAELNPVEDAVKITNWLKINMVKGEITLNGNPIQNFTGKVCGAYIRKREENLEFKIPAKIELVITFAYLEGNNVELCRISIDSTSVVLFKEFVNRIAANPSVTMKIRLWKKPTSENYTIIFTAPNGTNYLPLYHEWNPETKRYMNEPEPEYLLDSKGKPAIVNGKKVVNREKVFEFWEDICVQRILIPHNSDKVVFADAFKLCMNNENWFKRTDEIEIPEIQEESEF